MMKKILYALFSIVVLASCANSYNIQGSSNVSNLDGRMLYLKVLKNNDFKNLDSCDVIHGQFHFAGSFDSTRMASIFMDDESILPLVIESGDINIKIDNTKQVVSGTPLNDELTAFLNKFNQLKARQIELVHRHDQAIMDGKNMEVVSAQLNKESISISEEEDRLVTTFVTDNFDNVLGPGVFMMMTIANPYPELTPWIEDIMSKATDKFKNDPYVKDYYQKAQENEQIMNGLKEMPVAPPMVPTPPVQQLPPPPTPNDLAAPAK